jgi:predicted site-specific integrase-resolvase
VDLTGWAHARGIYVQAACRWYREGTLSVPVARAGRLTLVFPEKATEAARKTEGTGLYAQVSSDGQKSGLDGRVARLPAWVAAPGCRWRGWGPGSG